MSMGGAKAAISNFPGATSTVSTPTLNKAGLFSYYTQNSPLPLVPYWQSILN